jgi:putative polyhydroxyalkanoate system protein
MATIDIRRPHALSKDEAKKRAEELAKGMEAKLGLQWRWEGDHIRFEAPSGAAKGTTGTVEVTDSNVRVQIDLPFLLRVLKGKVESKVNEKLDQLL